MSHTTSIKAVVISSIPALRAALAELSKEGVKVTLAQNKKPRAYYSNQQGLGVAPYVIEVPGARYDVGLYPTADGKGFEARTDFWGGDVEKVLGAPACSVDSKEQAKIGKLFQKYAIHATLEAARKKGHTCRRVKGADGVEKIEITGV